jgi:hypothetical protein
MARTILPLPVRNEPWSPNVYHAFNILSDIFRTAKNILSQENYDLYRIRYHAETIENDALPLLLALEATAEEESLPVSWVYDAGSQYEDLIVELAEAEKRAVGMYASLSVRNIGLLTTFPESHRILDM